jgi:hypothetical protein
VRDGYRPLWHVASPCLQRAMSGEDPGVRQSHRRLGAHQPRVSGEISGVLRHVV